jgi:hypothetical protein
MFLFVDQVGNTKQINKQQYIDILIFSKIDLLQRK